MDMECDKKVIGSNITRLQLFYDTLPLVKDAGKMIMEGMSQEKKVQFKSSPRDLVTQVDTNVEEFLIGSLKKKYPSHEFIGEESVAAEGGQCLLTNKPTWIIDPLDGTTNFVHSLAYVCISIAFYVDKKAVLGIVYNPVLDKLYSAIDGRGAFLNDRPIYVSHQKDLSKSVVVTECGYRPDSDKMALVLRNMKVLVEGTNSVRCLGSAAMHMCLVADGSVDASVSLELFPWDKAAAVLIVTEAGGAVVDNSGEPDNVMKRRVLCAASKDLAKALVQKLECYDV